MIATGGLVTPGDSLKALALGADAVYMGTAIMMAQVGDQMTKTLPFEPPTDLIIYEAKMTDKLELERSVKNTVNFLKACVKEMELISYCVGKRALNEITTEDMCTLDPFLSRALQVDFGFVAPEEQNSFFEQMENVMETPYRAAPSFKENEEERRLH